MKYLTKLYQKNLTVLQIADFTDSTEEDVIAGLRSLHLEPRFG